MRSIVVCALSILVSCVSVYSCKAASDTDLPGQGGAAAGVSGSPNAGTAGRAEGDGDAGEGGSNSGGGGASGSDADSGASGASGAGEGGAAGAAGTGNDGDAGAGSGLPSIGGCISAQFGRYLLRTDGVLLFESEDATLGQPPILDAANALPLQGIVSVADGLAHGCAALEDKRVVCWRTSAGGNNAGQLGNGGLVDDGPLFRATPVLVAAGQPLKNVVALAEGSSGHSWGLNSCAITDTGAVSCWGSVSWLVNGGASLASPYAVPVTTDGVTPFSGVIQMSVTGDASYCALKANGNGKEVYCWGINYHGEAGTGDTAPKLYPTKVLGLSSPSKVVTFGWGVSTCAVDGGAVRCWGANGASIAGPSATSSDVLTPTLVTLMGAVTPLPNIVNIWGGSADVNQGIGNNAVCALATDNTLKCWGSGFQAFPTNYGIVDVVASGELRGNVPRLLTKDGVYHVGMSPVTPNCGAL